MKASESNRTIFRLYLAMIKKNMGYFAMYFGIFIGMALMFSNTQSSQAEALFQTARVTIPVIDRDRSEASKALTDFLAQGNDVYAFEGDEAELNRGLYYREMDYILTIPAGFGASLEPEGAQDVQLEVVKVPDSTAGYYIDADIEQFLMRYRAYLAAGFSAQEAGQHTLALQGSEGAVRIEAGTQNLATRPNWAYSLNYLPYLYLSVFIYCISFVLKAFRDRHVEDRLRASPIPARTQALQGFQAFALVFAAIWLLSLLIPLLAKGADFYTSPHRGWILLNSLVFMLVAASIGFLIGNLAHSDVVISALTNVVGLGMCFLGGVFVPPELQSESVQKISRFLPSWWYVRIVDLVSVRQGALSPADTRIVAEALLIQVAFAVAIFSLTLFLLRQKGREC